MSPSNIIATVPKKFENARQTGDLLLFQSTITRHQDLGVEFEVRLCPALQKKPHLISDHDGDSAQEKDHFDPFNPPYNPNLHVGDLQDEDGAEYVVLLNKYAVVSDHFLLVTKEFKSQSSPLMPSDLVQTYLVLSAARKTGKKYLAFYNCGDSSGASQPHKHIQFIPVEDDGPPIEKLARSANLETPDKPFSLSKLQYANHIFRLPAHLPSSSTDQLEKTLSSVFLALLDLVVSTIRHDPNYPPGKPSYNVLITLEHIHLIPRRREDYAIPGTVSPINVNALGFAGMLLVKSEEELEFLKKESIGKILCGVGLQSVHDIQVAETATEAE